MSITDPLSDMITRIRNGQAAGKTSVTMPSSKLKVSLCQVLKNEGYIGEYGIEEFEGKKSLTLALKYYKGEPVIESIQRISKPGCRSYKSKNDLPRVLGGLGISIISTSKGLMSDKSAMEKGHGGEVICIVY
jgi:small subunit ribosomal protein S8